MKLKLLAPLLSTLQLFNLSTFQQAHAKTFDWPIDSPAARAASFTAYHGETVRFNLRFGGAMTNLAPVAIYYQTNGMGRAEWFTVPGTVFAPSNDCGAAAYRFFVRCLDPDGVDYSANGTLRMLDSPGFEPSTVQLPVQTIDFAHVTALNAPWLDPFATNSLAASCAQACTLASRAATNYTDSATNSLAVTLRGEIANSTPGDYANVSNAAMSALQPSATNALAASCAQASRAATNYTDSATNDLAVTLRGEIAEATPEDYEQVHDKALSALQPDDDIQLEEITVGAALGLYSKGMQESRSATDIFEAIDSAITEESDPVAMPAVQAVSNEVAVLVATINGETARYVVTNFNNVAEKAAAEVEVKINGEWQTMWRELTRWDWLIGEYLPTNYYTKAECDANFADRAWGAFDPTTGNLTPDGKLWLSAPSIYICAGASYERVANAAGEYWVLTANGMVADINGVSSNGFFRIADSDGVTHFEIVKGDRQTLAAVAGAMRSETVMGVQHYFTTYYVTGAAETPKAQFARSLEKPVTWYDETDASCPYNVSWTAPESGTFVCEWWPKSDEAKGFMKASYQRGGETYIRNTAPVSVDGGILCTDGIHKVRPVYSNGSVTWEVVNP